MFIVTFSLQASFGRGNAGKGVLKHGLGQGYGQMPEVPAVFFSWQNGKLDALKISYYKIS